jgi:hypothetical protein
MFSGGGKPRQMAEEDDATKTFICQGPQDAKQLYDCPQRSSPLTLASRTRSSDKEPREMRISNMSG